MLAPHFSVSEEITGCRGITFYQCKLKTQRDYYSNTIFLIDLGFFIYYPSVLLVLHQQVQSTHNQKHKFPRLQNQKELLPVTSSLPAHYLPFIWLM